MADTSALEQKAVEIITNLQHLAEPAMQITLRSIQLSAAIDIVTSAIALAALGYVWLRYTPRVGKWFKELDSFSDASIPAGIACVIGAIASAILGGAAVMTLLSTTTWLSLFAPELALARMLLAKVT